MEWYTEGTGKEIYLYRTTEVRVEASAGDQVTRGPGHAVTTAARGTERIPGDGSTPWPLRPG